MTPRLVVVLAVAFVSACGGRTPPPSAPNRAATTRAVPESNTSDDYVVGPFVTDPQSDGEVGVRTYYIVRN